MPRAVIAVVVLVLTLGSAEAAGSYDGSWKGTIAGASVKCPDGTITMKIAGTAVTGALGLGAAKVPFRGTVAPDGSLNAAYDYPAHSLSGKLTGKLAGDTFTGTLDSAWSLSSACIRNVTAKHG